MRSRVESRHEREPIRIARGARYDSDEASRKATPLRLDRDLFYLFSSGGIKFAGSCVEFTELERGRTGTSSGLRCTCLRCGSGIARNPSRAYAWSLAINRLWSFDERDDTVIQYG